MYLSIITSNRADEASHKYSANEYFHTEKVSSQKIVIWKELSNHFRRKTAEILFRKFPLVHPLEKFFILDTLDVENLGVTLNDKFYNIWSQCVSNTPAMTGIELK